MAMLNNQRVISAKPREMGKDFKSPLFHSHERCSPQISGGDVTWPAYSVWMWLSMQTRNVSNVQCLRYVDLASKYDVGQWDQTIGY